MTGYLAILLHAHLPFVKHPEHAKALEESWLFEAMIETYLPLLHLLQRWQQDQVPVRLTLSISPTLGAMLRDGFLQQRFRRHLDGLIILTEKEILRTSFLKPQQALAKMYHQRLVQLRQFHANIGGNLIHAFGRARQNGALELITCSATHAVLPLLRHRPSAQTQIELACDYYEECFGCRPRGFWLPECGYRRELDPLLIQAGIRWCVVESRGLLQARPRPTHGVLAPIVTPRGLAVFGRDPGSAAQVWSRERGYPGHPYYREFHRDIGFDLDFDYVRDFLPSPSCRGFTGIKYHRVTGGTGDKQVYDHRQALAMVSRHAAHFVREREESLLAMLDNHSIRPILLAPYDAELFGHWWHEGVEFLDQVVRLIPAQKALILATPSDYLNRFPTHQKSVPAASSWGEGSDWRVWQNPKNAWVRPLLSRAQERLSRAICRHRRATGLVRRALDQAANELLLAQASDWTFMLNAGACASYARCRIKEHLDTLHRLCRQIEIGRIDGRALRKLEAAHHPFKTIRWHAWLEP